jgi:hypothetical protein
MRTHFFFLIFTLFSEMLRFRRPDDATLQADESEGLSEASPGETQVEPYRLCYIVLLLFEVVVSDHWVWLPHKSYYFLLSMIF